MSFIDPQSGDFDSHFCKCLVIPFLSNANAINDNPFQISRQEIQFCNSVSFSLQENETIQTIRKQHRILTTSSSERNFSCLTSEHYLEHLLQSTLLPSGKQTLVFTTASLRTKRHLVRSMNCRTGKRKCRCKSLQWK